MKSEMVNRPPAPLVRPPVAFEKHPRGGGECYVVDCGRCNKKLYSLGVECICPHCDAWLVLTGWRAEYKPKVKS